MFERDHPIRSDISMTPVQRGQRRFIYRRTIRIGGVAKVLQKIAGLLVGEPVDQQMKLFLKPSRFNCKLPGRAQRHALLA